MSKKNYSNILWDAFCFASVFGIWPRFIEPKLLSTTSFEVNLPKVKQPLKIIQLSDLHFNDAVNGNFLNKILQRVANESPDLILITGDFLCMGRMADAQELKDFLLSLKARLGIYAVLGNHDYTEGLNINSAGYYDTVKSTSLPALSGFKRLWEVPEVRGTATDAAKAVSPNPELLKVLQETSVTLLDNQTVQVGDLNLTGLGDLMADAVHPEKAFAGYDPDLPGVILAHNPDTVTRLKNYPGGLVLSGHTHGGQINLPWLWKRFTTMENMQFKSGLHKFQDKLLYISRGLGGVIPFRFNTIPELVTITIKRGIE
jgi:hypothetical protein